MKRIFRRLTWRQKTKVQPFRKKYCELHLCTRLPFLLFCFIGFFPVHGLWSKDYQNIRYAWYSLFNVFNILTLIGQSTLLVLNALWCFTNTPITTGSISNFLANLHVTIVLLLMRNIAKNWPQVLRTAAKIELRLGDIKKDETVRFKCKMITVIVLCALVLEYCTSHVYYVEVTKMCLNVTHLTTEYWIFFWKRSAPQVFHYTSFSTWKFVIYKILNIQIIIICGVLDTNVMCVSVYLVSFFRGLNKVIESHRSKFQNIRFWERHRLYYTQLETLVKIINDQVKNLILVSFFTFSFFACVQLFYLFNSNRFRLRPCNLVLEKMYYSIQHVMFFLLTVFFPLIRSITMCYLASNIRIEAQKPLIHLDDVQDSNYTLEIQRFRRQICYTPITLSGSLFYVTRNVILKTISTIITYELVLLQLNKNRRMNIATVIEYDKDTESANEINKP